MEAQTQYNCSYHGRYSQNLLNNFNNNALTLQVVLRPDQCTAILQYYLQSECCHMFNGLIRLSVLTNFKLLAGASVSSGQSAANVSKDPLTTKTLNKISTFRVKTLCSKHQNLVYQLGREVLPSIQVLLIRLSAYFLSDAK